MKGKDGLVSGRMGNRTIKPRLLKVIKVRRVHRAIYPVIGRKQPSNWRVKTQVKLSNCHCNAVAVN